ncbi:DUF58 domain-containing protein [Candidatus Formimonas warabiya]|uniref:Uncharacterized protein n=1 Tax=Formimonas warabiya TaxID=1761012 RepID=A0A3G1KMP3_FORW1|nr:DUF58 domain-containing protein [Candidatus Formimonas warabiya]ATW23726.1 hypothetical protein DCMF_01980 [Candidatus Formimonas warabiya]
MPNFSRVGAHHGSLVFSDRGLWGLTAIMLAALYYRYYSLVMLVTLVVIVWLLSRAWAKFVLQGVVFSERISVGEVFPLDPIKIEISVGNRSPLPILWLELERFFSSDGGKVEEESPFRLEKDGAEISRLGWIFWHQNSTHEYRISFKRRGYYRFGTAKLRSGDPFAFFFSEITVKVLPEVIVYPHFLPAERFALNRRDPLGNKADRNFLFTDPLFIIGLRDYHESDPLRRVNWKASARFQSLKSNIWEGKAANRSYIFLETGSLNAQHWSKEKEELAWEVLVSATATIAAAMTGKNQEWGFFTDIMAQSEDPKSYFISPSTSSPSGHLFQLLATLACLKRSAFRIRPSSLLNGAIIPLGVTLIVLSAASEPELHESLNTIAHRQRVVWMQLEPANEYEGVCEQIQLIPGWEDDPSLRELLGLNPAGEFSEGMPKRGSGL